MRYLSRGSKVFAVILFSIFFIRLSVQAAPLIIDHNHTDITLIPQHAIEQAKRRLHIAYGHSSHGSQLTTGMTGLISFANAGGLGLNLPPNIFAWNNGGEDGALDLHDEFVIGEADYWPQWFNGTRAYLDNPENADVNVVIWSWCGGVDDKYLAGTLQSEYLDPMAQLEAEYPQVHFVYMTGHVDYENDDANKAANKMIRDYCIANDKILYDFADIERYDPDGTYFEYVQDSCNYWGFASGGEWHLLGNWAEEWQESHTEGVDWYNCPSAHTPPLNANQKAYAAWYLWAVLGGWEGIGSPAGVTLTESGSTYVEEGGVGDSYQVVLSSQPDDDVIIWADPDEQLNLSGGPGIELSLVFTAANWNVPQLIEVEAYDDSLEECNHSGNIVHRAESDDFRYNDITANLSVTIRDNDRQGCFPTGGIPLLLLKR